VGLARKWLAAKRLPLRLRSTRARAPFAFSLLLLAAFFLGCVPYGAEKRADVSVAEGRGDERGFATRGGFDSQDIGAVAQKMAREILTTPEIANAKGIPTIVLLPLKNDSRLPINKDVFLERIMALLNEKSGGKVRFLARDRMVESESDRNLKQSIKGADFMLAGKLMGTSRASSWADDYVLYSFTVIDPNTSDIVCQRSHQIRKQGLQDAVYR